MLQSVKRARKRACEHKGMTMAVKKKKVNRCISDQPILSTSQPH